MPPSLRATLSRLRRPWPRSRPAPLPACPSGWEVGPPDFVGIGAQRSGSTWWFRNLVSHPDISRAEGARKETHFLDQFFERTFGAGDREAYAQYFPRRAGTIAGEWTPRYCEDPWVAPILAGAAPQARLLMIVRDPVRRYESGLAYNYVHGAPHHALVASAAFERGLYHAQLQRFLAWFPPEQLLLLQFERCVADPQAELRRTYEHLGVDPSWSPPGLGEAAHRGRGVRPELPPLVREALVQAYAPDSAALAAAFPSLDLALWPEVAAVTSR